MTRGRIPVHTVVGPDIIVFHACDAHTGMPALQISTLDWGGRWPHAAWNGDREEGRVNPHVLVNTQSDVVHIVSEESSEVVL
jgi:hypothetical protein